ESFTLSVTFTNTGNTGSYFYAGFSIWDHQPSVGDIPVFDGWSNKIYLSPGQQKSYSWTTSLNDVGNYWLQFGVWDETKSELFDKKPYPAQNLIEVIEPSPTCTITFYTNPPNVGSIVFNGVTYTNGQSGEYSSRTYSISANIPSGYKFKNWETSGGVSITDSTSFSTTVTVNGDGLLKANFEILVALTIKGIDVSHYQGDIDWSEVYNAGYRFAFIKATEGDDRPPVLIDDYFEKNMEEGHAAGVLVGAYHFAHPESNDPVREAQFFISVAGKYLKEGYLRPALDIETGANLGKSYLSNWINEWMNTVKSETGVEPILYVNSNYARDYLDGSIANYDLWIAHWTCDPNASPNIGIWDDWDFWQYYSPDYCGENYVPGINGGVDLNIFNGDMSRLQDFIITTAQTQRPYPVITSPLQIFSSSPYYPYHVGDSLTSTFSITNRGRASITFDILVVGGRINNEVVDFAKAYGITLNPGESYDYIGNLVLEKPGTYYFFCAYYIENPTEEEKKLLDKNNWNTAIPVEIEGEVITNPNEAQRYRAMSINVLEETTYITPSLPGLWNEIHGPWEEISDDMVYEIQQIVVDPNDAENIYVLVQYKRWGWPGGYWPKTEHIFKLSAGKWKEITGNLPFLIANTIAVAPSDPNVIYVGGEKGGVYKSVNGGVSWTSLNGPEVGWWIFKTNPRIFSIAVDPVDPNTVYVGTESGAWRKKDGGDWEKITGDIIPKIEINPYEPGIIYASSIVEYSEGVYRSGGILRSEDGGNSWKRKWTKGIVNDIGIATEGKMYVATGSYPTKFILPGLTEAALVDFPIFADGILRYDGGNWGDRNNWHDARGKEGHNPLPDAIPYSVCMYPDFPNMVFVAFPSEGIMYSPNFGNDWFSLGLQGKNIKGLLLITTNSNSLVLYAYGAKNLFKLELSTTAIIARVHSPVELRVYDSQGNVTGLVNGTIKEEIPFSLYDNESKTVIIFYANDTYRYELVGTGNGTYELTANNIKGENISTFAITNVSITMGIKHEYTIDWNNLSETGGGITRIEYNNTNKSKQTLVLYSPTPSFICSSTNPAVNQKVPFDGSSSYDKDGSIVSYTWDFGDGNISHGKMVNHSYSHPGNYTVTLTVIDNDGIINTYSIEIKVKEKKGIPGFEVIVLTIAMTFAAIIYAKKRRIN
ncbi:MAG TPA: PKD domain-containing protein, partial [Thermoplasmatales archaeon]|nr:PKD domain-containing protein [Thermoplasmatales archaeon]